MQEIVNDEFAGTPVTVTYCPLCNSAVALTALLVVRRAIAADRGHVDDASWQAALDAGWSDVQLLDAYADVIRTVMTNGFNHPVDTEFDLPAAPPLP